MVFLKKTLFILLFITIILTGCGTGSSSHTFNVKVGDVKSIKVEEITLFEREYTKLLPLLNDKEFTTEKEEAIDIMSTIVIDADKTYEIKIYNNDVITLKIGKKTYYHKTSIALLGLFSEIIKYDYTNENFFAMKVTDTTKQSMDEVLFVMQDSTEIYEFISDVELKSIRLYTTKYVNGTVQKDKLVNEYFEVIPETRIVIEATPTETTPTMILEFTNIYGITMQVTPEYNGQIGELEFVPKRIS